MITGNELRACKGGQDLELKKHQDLINIQDEALNFMAIHKETLETKVQRIKICSLTIFMKIFYKYFIYHDIIKA